MNGASLVPAPPPMGSAPCQVAFYDTEAYPNYWLLKFRPRGAVVYTFKLHAGESFSPSEAARIRLLFEAFTTISFNGNGYDVPLITGALMGYTPEQLKWLNDQIIVYKVRPWDLNLPEWKPVDHIDIMEVIPGAGSQKLFAGRIHYKTMRDLPYEPGTYLTPEQIANVDEYCENDLGQLEALYHEVTPQIKLRAKYGARYGLDLRSKSDAQVAEAVLKRRCEQAIGQKIYKPVIDWNFAFRYRTPDFIAFATPQLQHVLGLVQESVFRLNEPGTVTKGKAVAMPPQLEGLTVTIGAATYSLGIGGLHSQEKSKSYQADENYVLRDIDVASYYPSLIINSGEVPPALGETFVMEYKAIKAERLAAKALQAKLKKSGDTSSDEYMQAMIDNEGGKIQLNGTFGKTGSPHSVLWAPTMMIQTTLTGQLSLLMLIEWHEHYGIQIISANTDGIVTRCPKDKLHVSDALIKEWERRTGLEMEFTEYRGIFIKDVNNYFAIYK